jgi:rRNA maturation protein Nop10
LMLSITLTSLLLKPASTMVPVPPRYSPEDRYGEYRRRLKKERGEGNG